MTITLKRVGDKSDYAPMAQTISLREHHLITDGTLAEGGQDMGPNPHDLYDAALGACKALTVLWYARRKCIPVDEIQTSVERDDSGERGGTYRLATLLRIGGDLSEAQLRELETVAGKCPVHKLMTSVTTEVTTAVERLV